ncbi:MAG: hypothetical protein CMK89_05725 [Pseudomonadales bacterium]|nr:hypothetical protein [Pseudomonadales bacterium]
MDKNSFMLKNLCGVLLFVSSLLCLGACDTNPLALTEEDVERYIRAYENIAEVSGELEQARIDSKSLTIFDCEECRSIWRRAVQDAGYSDLKRFMLADLRINYTMHYAAYFRIGQMLGELGQDVSLEEVCRNPVLRRNLYEEEKAELDEYCGRAVAISRYVQMLSKFVTVISLEVLSKADFDIVNRYFDRLFEAISNPDLPSDLRRGSGDWDD